MNSKYCLVILANNLLLVDGFLKLFPKENQNIDIFLVNEVRIGDKRDHLKQLVNKYENINFKNLYIMSSNKIIKWFKNETEINNRFLKIYVMGMNILIPPFFNRFYDKILFCDDDVIILNNDLLSLFNSYDFLARSCGWNGLSANNHLFIEFNNVFESNFDINEYNKTINNGVRIYSYIDDYIKWLCNFYLSDKLYNVYIRSIYPRGRGFFYDYIFENFIRLKLGDKYKINDEFCWMGRSKNMVVSSRFKFKPIIYHYAVGSKYEFLKSFIKMYEGRKK